MGSFETLFDNLSVDHVMFVVSCVLCERRMIFHSNSIEKLSSCIHAVYALITPFQWHYIFIPILPESFLNYLTAPMPFLIGLVSSLLPKVPKMELSEVVMVDLD